MFDVASALGDLGEFECRLLALLVVEQLLPHLDAVTPMRSAGPSASLRAELSSVVERQWGELEGAAALEPATAERDAHAVMSAIMENNTYVSDAAPGDSRASNADATLQALYAVVERSRTHRRSDGALVRHPFDARTVREVLGQYESVAAAPATSIASLLEGVRVVAGDAQRALALREKVRTELAKPSRR